jgi:hypothetical protein
MNIQNQFAYMIANEKMVNMLSTIDQTMAFMQEYEIIPDDEVKKALIPVIKQLERWIK